MTMLVLAHGALHVLEVLGLTVGVLLPFVGLAVLVAVVKRRDERAAARQRDQATALPPENAAS